MNVNNEDFEFMKECAIRDILIILVEERGLSIQQAFNIFYNSKTFLKLESPETGLFFQSPRYILSYLDSEMNYK